MNDALRATTVPTKNINPDMEYKRLPSIPMYTASAPHTNKAPAQNANNLLLVSSFIFS